MVHWVYYSLALIGNHIGVQTNTYLQYKTCVTEGEKQRQQGKNRVLLFFTTNSLYLSMTWKTEKNNCIGVYQPCWDKSLFSNNIIQPPNIWQNILFGKKHTVFSIFKKQPPPQTTTWWNSNNLAGFKVHFSSWSRGLSKFYVTENPLLGVLKSSIGGAQFLPISILGVLNSNIKRLSVPRIRLSRFTRVV